MKNYTIILLVSALLCSCGKKSATTLTEQQQTDGWKSLFDGKTLTGWKIFKDRKNNSWEVQDGTLHCKAPIETPGVDNERSDLMTIEQFENFELELEWKIAPQSNSGIMFRVTEEFDQPYFSGPEYQIIDDLNYPGGLKEENKTASNYDMHVATEKELKPVGEWNLTKLVVDGNRVEHWLNNKKVLEYELGSEDWINRKNACKWKDVAGYGAVRKGSIDLQDHGSEIWFRNIRIKPR